MFRNVGMAKNSELAVALGKCVTMSSKQFRPSFRKTSSKAIVLEHLICFCDGYQFFDQFSKLRFLYFQGLISTLGVEILYINYRGEDLD